MRQPERDATYIEYVAARETTFKRVAYALSGDWARAEDLLQTAFTKLYVAWPRLVRQGAEDAYVRWILLTTHLDERRRGWTRHERAGLDGLDRPGPVADDPAATGDLRRDELIEALRLLPPMQRAVVVLRQLCDLSVAQAAAELGIEPGTVKSHHSRALTRLRELLAQPAGPTGVRTCDQED